MSEVLGESILVDRYPYNGVPIIWPVTIDDLKRHIQIDHSSDDRLLAFGTNGYLAAATEYVEARGQVSLMYQKRRIVLDEMLADRALHITRGPLVSITSVTYLDKTEALQTLASTHYRALCNGRGSSVYFKESASGFVVASGPGAVQVNAICGMGDEPDKIPAMWRQIVAEVAAYFYERRDGVAGGGIDDAMDRVFARKISAAGGVMRYV